jgi:hypothetical protein
VLLRLSLVWLLLLLTTSSFAEAPLYIRHSLGEGISIEVPSHWIVHADEERRNFAAAASAAISSTGQSEPTKRQLFAASATPTPSEAKIRVNTYRPSLFTASDLRAATKAELASIRADMQSELSRTFTAMGARLVSMDEPEIVLINGRQALAISYYRTDPKSKSPWRVRMIRMPMGDKTVELTLSYNTWNEPLWRSILAHTVRTFRY